jgi:hypothetical protein
LIPLTIADCPSQKVFADPGWFWTYPQYVPLLKEIRERAFSQNDRYDQQPLELANEAVLELHGWRCQTD